MSLQKENGKFTLIINEVLEQLVKGSLLGSEYQVALFVIRKTWGWQKTQDKISFSQFEQGTGLSRATINKTLKNLISKKILVKGDILDRQGNTYKFNKYHHQWLVNTPKLVKYNDPTSILKLEKLVEGGIHTKETTKENKKELLKNKEKTEKIKQELRERWGKKNANS